MAHIKRTCKFVKINKIQLSYVLALILCGAWMQLILITIYSPQRILCYFVLLCYL